jgi:DNA-binding PadR family transcriptional regulator
MFYKMMVMKRISLGRLELAALVTVARLHDEAYGMNVRRDLSERTGRDYSVGAIYTTLLRLQDKGLLKTRVGESFPVRGGRSRSHYYLTAAGTRTLREAERNATALWEGFGGVIGGTAR